MRHTDALVLLGALASTAPVAVAGSPRGVGPEFVKFYQSKDSFACIGHPSIVLKPSQVNDNSCDCPDGSDEPGTAACASLDPLSPSQPLACSQTGSTKTTNVLPGFWCNNEGHIGAYLPFMYVNDGICDYELCCDGSDEFGRVGGVKCENRCAAIGKEHRRVEEERKKSMERAVKRRRTMIKEGKELRRQVEARIANLKVEISALEIKRDDLERQYREVERQEKGKVVKNVGAGGKLGVLVGLAKARVNELRDTLDKVLDQRDDLQDKVDELAAILKKFKEEYNPNFNDEGVKAAVKAWEDYAAKVADDPKPDVDEADVLELLKEDGETSGVNWAEFETEEASDTDILYNLNAYLPGPIKEFIESKMTSLRVWLVDNGMLADKSGSNESKVVKTARDAHSAAASEVSSKQHRLGEEEDDLATDYGPDGIFRSMKHKCVSTEAGEYEYELCWWGQTMQKSKKGHGNTGMGQFRRIEMHEADDEERNDGKSLGKGQRMVLKYEDGQHCWNGPARRTDVWLGCAEKEEVWRVSEAEKCVYKMEVGTPAACEDPGEAAAQGKDEL